MSLGGRVDLEGDVVARVEVSEGGGEQPPGVSSSTASPSRAKSTVMRAPAVRAARMRSARGGVRKPGASSSSRRVASASAAVIRSAGSGAWPETTGFEHGSRDASRVFQGRVVDAADRLGPGLKP